MLLKKGEISSFGDKRSGYKRCLRKRKKFYKEPFSLKQVHIVAGDFINNEATREEMTSLLLDKVNAK